MISTVVYLRHWLSGPGQYRQKGPLGTPESCRRRACVGKQLLEHSGNSATVPAREPPEQHEVHCLRATPGFQGRQSCRRWRHCCRRKWHTNLGASR